MLVALMPHTGQIPVLMRGPATWNPPMTNRAHYYVVYDGEWKIQCDGENSEPYSRRSDAFKISGEQRRQVWVARVG